ncbi:MAG: HAD-IIIC family phosphatase [Planctomycetota bacterium]|jgi:FkbH-like protein
MKKPFLSFIGGCEFVNVIDEIVSHPEEYFEFDGFYSFADSGQTNAYLFVKEHWEQIARPNPDVVIISQIDVLTAIIEEIQFARNNSKTELDSRLDEVIAQCEEMIQKLSQLSVPILLQFFPWSRTNMISLFKPVPGTYSENQILRKYSTAMEALALKYPNFYFMDLTNICAFYGYIDTLKMGDRPWETHIGTSAGHVAQEFTRWINYVLGRDKKVKLVLVDLDNTLWHGVIRDDGIENLQIRPFIERFRLEVLRILFSRGILLGIVSKNDPELEEQILKFIDPCIWWARFACIKLGWQDKWEYVKQIKWEYVKQIQQELNIGLDSILFIDDNEFERQQMSTMLPEVRVADENIFEELLYLPELQPKFVTEESKNRTQYYLEEKQRKSTSETLSREDFLKNCDFRISVKKIEPHEISRVTELIQRTNQLNTSIRRYSQSEVVAFSRDADCEIFTVHVSDKFGKYGLVGACIGFRRQDVYEIDTMLFSCRIMSRGVEDYTLSWILNQAANENFDRVVLRFIKGPKNNQMQTILNNNGFIESVCEDYLVYTFDLKNRQINPYPCWFSAMLPDVQEESAASLQPAKA